MIHRSKWSLQVSKHLLELKFDISIDFFYFVIFCVFFFNSVKQDKFLSMASGSIFSGIHILRDMPRLWNPYTFEDPKIQDFIHSTHLHFDLVINEEFFGDSYLMFAHKFKAPIVTICKFRNSIQFYC